MLPISSKRRVPFTPPHREGDEPKPVYWLRVPTIADRAEFDCALADRRAGLVLRRQFCAEARRAITAIDPVTREELLALLERVAGVPDTTPLADADAAPMNALEAMLEEHWPEYGRLMARNRRFWTHAPVLAATMFLVGWQDGPDGQNRTALDDQARMAIPTDDLRALGWKAWHLMHVSEAQAKNSDSPSRSA